MMSATGRAVRPRVGRADRIGVAEVTGFANEQAAGAVPNGHRLRLGRWPLYAPAPRSLHVVARGGVNVYAGPPYADRTFRPRGGRSNEWVLVAASRVPE